MIDIWNEPNLVGILRLIGDTALSRLTESNILLMGQNAVIEWIFESLARSGVGGLICCVSTDRPASPSGLFTYNKDDVVSDIWLRRAHEIQPKIRTEVIEWTLSTESNWAQLSQRMNGTPSIAICVSDHEVELLSFINWCRAHTCLALLVTGSTRHLDIDTLCRGGVSEWTHDPVLKKVKRQLNELYPNDPWVHNAVRAVYSASYPSIEPSTVDPVIRHGMIGLMAAAEVMERIGQY